MTLPKISIVTVTYNCEDVIEKTLLSVAEQTHPSIEHIVIDGASTDRTTDVIALHRNKLAYYVSEPDSGLYDAMNKGLAAASGDYVFFLNAGDVFADNSVVSQMFDGIVRADRGLFGYVKILTKLGTWFSPYEGKSFVEHAGYLPHHQSIFYPKSFYQSNRFDLNFSTQADIIYTALACRDRTPKFRPIHTVNSTMGGFSTNLFNNRQKTAALISELAAISAIVHGGVPEDYRRKVAFNSYIKWITRKVCGEVGLFQLFRLNAFFSSLRRGFA